MFTDKKDRIIAGMGVALLLVAVLLCKFGYDQHQALDKAQADSAIVAKAEAALASERERKAEADLLQQKQAGVAQVAVKTSADAVRTIIQYIPQPVAAAVNAPPQTSVIQKQDLSAAAQAKVPEAPSYVLQTQDAATAMAKQLIQCSADRTSLTSCKSQLADADQQQAALRNEVTVWKNAAKGGSKSKRFLKFVACAASGAGGAAAGAITKQPVWAAVGGAAGFTACQVLF